MEETTQTEVAPEVKAKPKLIVSARLSNENMAERFHQVLNWRIAKGKSRNMSEFIEQLFVYAEKNPYGDFPTGR